MLIRLLLTLLIAASVAVAQPTREQATSNPLDCALYILTHRGLESWSEQRVARLLLDAGRFDDVLTAVRSKNASYRPDTIADLALQAFKRGDRKASAELAREAHERAKDSWSASEYIRVIPTLIATSQPDLAEELVDLPEEPRDKLAARIALIRAYLDFDDEASARKSLDRATELLENVSDGDGLADLADQCLRLKEQTLYTAVLDQLERQTRYSSEYGTYRRIYLFRRYYLLGETKKAMSVWESFHKPDDISHTLIFAQTLIENGERARAEKILRSVGQEQLGQREAGRAVVELLIALGKLELAEHTADLISAEDDDYDQQESFLKLADHYLKSRDNKNARRVVEKAFRKARRIKFEHEDHNSIGASSGSRKTIYLREIAKRFEKMGDTQRAFEAISSLRDPHPYAVESLAVELADFAKRNAKSISLERLDKIAQSSLSLLDEENSIDYPGAQVRIHLAEAYALKGRAETSSDILGELIEGSLDEDDALIPASELFEKYKLPLTERLKTGLVAILDDNE